MKLKFLGTKGEIEEQTKGHKYQSSLLIEEAGFKLLVDHGVISKSLSKIKPKAILITHAHPDHFVWLKKDEDCKGKIYLTKEAREDSKFDKNFVIIKKDSWFKIGPFKILAYPVVHSLRAPTVGFKIKTDKIIIYNPDIIVMKNKSILKDVDLYIGDGSCYRANLVRRRGDKLFGHARPTTQINWCKKYNIKNIIFTHFGKEPLRIGDAELQQKLAQENMNIKIAYDGMEYELK